MIIRLHSLLQNMLLYALCEPFMRTYPKVLVYKRYMFASLLVYKGGGFIREFSKPGDQFLILCFYNVPVAFTFVTVFNNGIDVRIGFRHNITHKLFDYVFQFVFKLCLLTHVLIK